MTRLYWFLFFVAISGCASSPVNKSALQENADRDSVDAVRAYQNEEWVKSQRLFNRALSVYQAVDDRSAVLGSHINLVEVALAKHNIDAAARQLSEAEEVVKTEGLVSYQPRITLLQALLSIQKNEMAMASTLLQKILPRFTHSKEVSYLQLAAIGARVDIAFFQGKQIEKWVSRYADGLRFIGDNPRAEAKLLRFQAKIMLLQEAYPAAETNLKQALALYKQQLSRVGIAGTLVELAELSLKQADSLHAANYYKRALSVFRSLDHQQKVAKVIEKLNKI